MLIRIRRILQVLLAVLLVLLLGTFVLGRGPGTLVWLTGSPPPWLPFAGSGVSWLPFLAAGASSSDQPQTSPSPSP